MEIVETFLEEKENIFISPAFAVGQNTAEIRKQNSILVLLLGVQILAFFTRGLMKLKAWTLKISLTTKHYFDLLCEKRF